MIHPVPIRIFKFSPMQFSVAETEMGSKAHRDVADSEGSDDEDKIIKEVISNQWTLQQALLCNCGTKINRKRPLRNRDGSIRKVNRLDYSRGAKRLKPQNYWTESMWLRFQSIGERS